MATIVPKGVSGPAAKGTTVKVADPVDEAISDVLVTMHGISGVDYCKHNAITKMDVYSLPMIDDSLYLLSGQQFFTTLDLASGYRHACGTCPIAAIWLLHAANFSFVFSLVSPVGFVGSEQE